MDRAPNNNFGAKEKTTISGLTDFIMPMSHFARVEKVYNELSSGLKNSES